MLGRMCLTPPCSVHCSAFHVTAVERWLYLALACKESLVANQVESRAAAAAFPFMWAVDGWSCGLLLVAAPPAGSMAHSL